MAGLEPGHPGLIVQWREGASAAVPGVVEDRKLARSNLQEHMAGRFDSIDSEIAAGRLWRAKEMLAGRVADAGYDAELFERFARVLAEMRDDDVAGRYFLLAGVRDGEGGMLARAFLKRRQKQKLAVLWATMPAAARRLTLARLPDGTRALLTEAGFTAAAVERMVQGLGRDAALRERLRKRRPVQWPQTRSATVFAWFVFLLLLLIMALGLLRTIDLAIDLLRRVL